MVVILFGRIGGPAVWIASLNFGHSLLIFLILTEFLLSETDQIHGWGHHNECDNFEATFHIALAGLIALTYRLYDQLLVLVC